MSKTILLLALVAAALAGDNLTIITNCTKCAENGTKDCFYLNGGPFNQFQIPVANTSYKSCVSPSVLSFPETATFSCGGDQNCTNNSCFLKLSTYATNGWCTTYSLATSAINTLNIFYSLSIGDPTGDSTYPWCDNLCGPGLPLWAIIVIAVAAVIVIVAIVVGVWWWRKKGGKLPNFNTDRAEKLLK